MDSEHHRRPMHSGPLELVVSTWHVAPLSGGRAEGLPTDLLTRHSALFYLVDSVVCDVSGYAGELKWEDYWLSAKMFKRLEEVGLIRVADLNASPFLPSDFWTHLPATETGRAALQRLDEISSKLRTHNPDPKLTEQFDPLLIQLNRSIFLNLSIPENWLPYYQTESHLRGHPDRQVDLLDLSVSRPTDVRWRAQRLSRLIELVEKYLPDPQLLPPPSSPAMKGALTRITDAEKLELYKVLYGVQSHDNFQNFRRDEKRFRPWDRLLDTSERLSIAEANLDRLLMIRHQTSDIRRELQQLVIAIVDGQIPLRDACDLVTGQVTEFHNFVNTQLPLPLRHAGTAVGVAADLVDFYFTKEFRGYPSIGPFGPVTGASYVLGRIQGHLLRRYLESRRMNQGRQEFPLAALHHDLEEILGSGLI